MPFFIGLEANPNVNPNNGLAIAAQSARLGNRTGAGLRGARLLHTYSTILLRARRDDDADPPATAFGAPELRQEVRT